MKKSQLRNIIRTTIKEQLGNPCPPLNPNGPYPTNWDPNTWYNSWPPIVNPNSNWLINNWGGVCNFVQNKKNEAFF